MYLIKWMNSTNCLLKIIWNDYTIKKDPFFIIRKSHVRYKKHGLSGMWERLKKDCQKKGFYLTVKQSSRVYIEWIKKNEKNIKSKEKLVFNPMISIAVPVYNTEPKYLKAMLDSVLHQTYTNWELCISDDNSSNSDTIKLLKKYEEKYINIKLLLRKENGHISEATNTALELVSGEYVVFLDHDDTLSPNALFEIVKKLNENRQLKLIYSDEDKIDEYGKRFDPHFKSDWNPDMFFSQNYISHLICLKKEIIDQVGGLRKGYEGSQDYDLLLRSLNYIKEEEIVHISKILYHWRAIKGSTAYLPGEKDYTHEAGKRALEDYFSKQNKDITITDGLLPNTYKVNYPLPKDPPLVSLLVPTRDGYDILYKCIESILEKTVYPNYEIIILDNETTCTKTLSYFKKLEKYPNITILEYHYPFNYSAINNFGMKYAKGEILGLINNDVEIITDHWLTEMVSHAIRPEIGAVGAMLYYDNDTIQHAGIILGIGGVAGHGHKNFPKGSFGYFSRLKIIQNYSAVTAACLVLRKSLYVEVNGLDEKNLSVAFNDVDFCLKLKENGYRNLWTPYVELYHHESISRGEEDTKEKQERFSKEVCFMKRKWEEKLNNDLYYNQHLTKTYEDFRIGN